MPDRGAGADQRQVATWRPWPGQKKPGDFHAVTGHVGEHAATLLAALPEPGHVRAAMLLGRAGEIGPASAGHGAAPDDLLAPLHGRREDLVLEIAVVEAGILRQAQLLARLGQGAGQRLLA